MGGFNIYCDESCHLEHDGEKAMVLGAVMCPAARTHAIAEQIRDIKEAYGLPRHHEVKWTKVSPAKLKFYSALVDYFFTQDDLRFRALVVPDKSVLNCEAYGLTHDGFYYRMYYQMLRPLLQSQGPYRIFLDIKDTRSAHKTAKLGQVLANKFHDFERKRILPIETVRSEHVQQVQLADLLIGATGYTNRGRSTSRAKAALVERIQQRAGVPLTKNSDPWARKFNVFVWRSAEELARE